MVPLTAQSLSGMASLDRRQLHCGMPYDGMCITRQECLYGKAASGMGTAYCNLRDCAMRRHKRIAFLIYILGKCIEACAKSRIRGLHLWCVLMQMSDIEAFLRVSFAETGERSV